MVLVGLVLVLGLVAAACGDDEGTATTEPLPPLVVWADDKFAPSIQAVAAPFTEQTGVQVEVTLIDYQDMREQIVTAAPVGEDPDIVIGGHDWVGETVENGIAAPIDLGTKAESITGVSRNAFTLDGVLCALPYAVENIALYYNADPVTTPPTLVEELTAICDEPGDAIDNCWGVQGGGGSRFSCGRADPRRSSDCPLAGGCAWWDGAT